MKQRNAPASKQIYFGSGETGETLIRNIEKASNKALVSFSRYIVEQLKIANPNLFKGVQDGK